MSEVTEEEDDDVSVNLGAEASSKEAEDTGGEEAAAVASTHVIAKKTSEKRYTRADLLLKRL